MHAKYITTKQIMERFGISGKATLWRWQKDRDFPRPAIAGKPNRWLLSSVEAWELKQMQR